MVSAEPTVIIVPPRGTPYFFTIHSYLLLALSEVRVWLFLTIS